MSESIISELFPALSLEDKEEQQVTLKKEEEEVTLEGTSGTLKKPSMTLSDSSRKLKKKKKETRKNDEWKKFLGVRLAAGMYAAIIRTPPHVGGYRLWLGTYKSPKVAALVYDRAAYKLYGSEATLNFPERIRTSMAEPNPTSMSPDDGQNN